MTITAGTTWQSAGPSAATLSEDGQWLVISFGHIENHSKTIDVVIPAHGLEKLQAALDQLAKLVADPKSGIRVEPPH